MADLTAKTPCDGLLPQEIGGVRLTEETPGHITHLAPLKGQAKAFSAALKEAHGMAAPAPGRSGGRAEARVLWFAPSQFLLIGPSPDPALAALAALTDHSDAWAVVRLEGDGAADVLARLTPLDLRPSVFRRGRTARTLLQHMSASITRLGDARFQLLVFRSMAHTLVHELETAMLGVNARAALAAGDGDQRGM